MTTTPGTAQTTTGLTRITINTTPRGQAALRIIRRSRGSSQTDAVNWALSVAAEIQKVADDGREIVFRDAGQPETSEIQRFL